MDRLNLSFTKKYFSFTLTPRIIILPKDIRNYFFYGRKAIIESNLGDLEIVPKPILVLGHGLKKEDLTTIDLYKSDIFYKYIPQTKGFQDALVQDEKFPEFLK